MHHGSTQFNRATFFSSIFSLNSTGTNAAGHTIGFTSRPAACLKSKLGLFSGEYGPGLFALNTNSEEIRESFSRAKSWKQG